MARGDGGAVAWIALALLAAAALVPLCGPIDARLDGVLEGWRTCRGLVLAGWLSDRVLPIGVGLLAVAVARAFWRGRPAPMEIVQILAALGAGILMVGALKDVLDRPRPGAEFLDFGGGSFPSGHVANTVLNGLAILTLWSGGTQDARRWRGWIVLAVLVAIVAAARVYERRHWPSDTAGALAIAGAYGLLAIRHPDVRWRTAASVGGLLIALGAQLAVARGSKLALPAGSIASSRPPLQHVAFGALYADGSLLGDWTLDGPDARRRSAWLRSDAGEVVLPRHGAGADEVRLVGRPRSDLSPDACQRLRVELNGRVLGEPVFQVGWRAYVFPIDPDDLRPERNLLRVTVRGDELPAPGAAVRRAAFSELTLHAAGATIAP